MPNVKIFVEQSVIEERLDALERSLIPLRQSLCQEFSVPEAACQIALVPVIGAAGQPVANMEIHYLSKSDRTPEMIAAACSVFRGILEPALGKVPAVRASALDPSTYVALKA